MRKGFVSSTKSYAKNLAAHVRHVVTRKETPGEALTRIKSDSKKLKRSLTSSDSSDSHKDAIRLVKRGRARYNAHDYEEAEECFQSAIAEDPDYALALTYLGHTLYQMRRTNEAMAAWQRAYLVDPTSRAGLKALKKLRHVAKGGTGAVHELIERTFR